jgi:hypothetical protein
MKLSLASTAELYREHRRTQSRRKKEKIADELQRRHDEQNGGEYVWGAYLNLLGGGEQWVLFCRYDFRLLL